MTSRKNEIYTFEQCINIKCREKNETQAGRLQDREGSWKVIKANQLNEDSSIIVELKNYGLQDNTEEFELCIVEHPSIPSLRRTSSKT